MNKVTRNIVYACTLLLVLLTAIVGQEVHIYNEDPRHFEAFCRDLGPDNGGDSKVVEKCAVCDFCFNPAICTQTIYFDARFEFLGRAADVATCNKQQVAMPLRALRAPPVLG